MVKSKKFKLLQGIAPVLIIVGVAIAAAVGFVAYKKVAKPAPSKPPTANVPSLPANAGELQNEGCNLSVRYPDGWTIAFNNTGPGEFKDDKWEGHCMIGLQSTKIDAPFAFLLNETPPEQTFDDRTNDLLTNSQRNIGSSSNINDLQILGNNYKVRFDETSDKGVMSTYIKSGNYVFEVIGLYNPNQPETKDEVIQILTSLKAN